MEIGLIAFILTLISLISGLVALVLMVRDSAYFPQYDRLVSCLLVLTVLCFASSWALVRIVEAGLWR